MRKVVFKYGNRKMYCKSEKRFVKYQDLVYWLNSNTAFVIYCHKTKRDITDSVKGMAVSLLNYRGSRSL